MTPGVQVLVDLVLTLASHDLLELRFFTFTRNRFLSEREQQRRRQQQLAPAGPAGRPGGRSWSIKDDLFGKFASNLTPDKVWVCGPAAPVRCFIKDVPPRSMLVLPKQTC